MYKKTNIFLSIVLLFFCTSSLRSINQENTPLYKTKEIHHEARDIWIIVHGTFARFSSWHKHEGDFFKTLQTVTGCPVYTFSWSGKLSAQARLDAGFILKEFILSIARPCDRLHVICHSHGGNVAIIAAIYLEQEKSGLYIDELILLGTPIPARLKIPTMQRIKHIYNLFSYGDRVQPILQDFKRVFHPHPNIFNIQLKLNKFCPDHKQMHHPLIAQHVPQLTRLIKAHKERDLVIHLAHNQEPIIEHDVTRTQDLEIDRIDHNIIYSIVDRGRNNHETQFKKNNTITDEQKNMVEIDLFQSIFEIYKENCRSERPGS